MREIASEPVRQHFLKQNSFQFVPELALSDAGNTKILWERIPWLRTSHGKVAMVDVLAYAHHYNRWVGGGGGEEMIKSPIIIEGARIEGGEVEKLNNLNISLHSLSTNHAVVEVVLQYRRDLA